MIRIVVACLLEGLACPLAGQIKPASSDVTVILDFQRPHSAAVALEMEHEAGLILAPSGIMLAWVPRYKATGAYKDLVVIRFMGSCESDLIPSAYDESGPFASTSIVDGEVLPFGEVDCGKIVGSVRAAMYAANDWARADRLVGRALGRVVVHELVHMLTKSTEHSREGIERPALSGRQLIEPSLALSAVDLDRLRQTIASRERQRRPVELGFKEPEQESVATTAR